jgi:hypothetical protein
MAKRKIKSQISNLTSTTKSQESTQFPCVQATCDIPLESSQKGYNFALDLVAIGGLRKKLCTLKVAGVPIVGISGLSHGSPGTKRPLGCGPHGEVQSIL